MARAIYSGEKLLLLDDCFSGLDATTEDRMFNRLFGRTGLFRGNGITVVLATHAAHRLSFADNIIALDSHGHLVTDHGKYLSSIAIEISPQDDESKSVEPVVDSTLRGLLDDESDEIVADTDEKRSAGDWTTYVHYFESCGWVSTICFGCGLCGFAIFMRMPGMIPPIRSGAGTKMQTS